MTRRRPKPGAPTRWWTTDEWEASEARDRERRDAAVHPPSTSTAPRRCATCGHWNATTAWLCADCGLPFIPRPLGHTPPAA